MSKRTTYEEVVIENKVFLKICHINELSEGKGKRFFYGDEPDMQFAVYKINGKLYSLNNVCPHRHQDQMHKGIIRGLNVMCPAHGWTYSLVTGKNISKKQGVKSLESYKNFVRDDYVYVEKPNFSPAKWKNYDSFENK